ncbi:hypothetical protein AMJ44_05850 [candidate division WOR-1 bacterium DG_54_3]|uniref:Glycoside hydrolase family 42 N-terminal domain-containing protein n=1 Tax=candidate division WOR-1 bacterium DG_54_3 TaxID=1703775 RepID=A0A0S7Y257_UNCSA|nr:MAG: hypothetical protein AMJ44_05850 [candidate division WOR-1 bacterium DG_54_3]
MKSAFIRKLRTFAQHMICNPIILMSYTALNLLFPICSHAAPRIDQVDQKRFLSVNGNPFIVMSIEDHRTTGFDGAVREEYFQIAKQLYANAITVTFRWSYFEKKEGQYDTTILRNIKKNADKYNLKVVILWFGTNLGGHGNSAPKFVLDDSITYIPYTRRDKSFATRVQGFRTQRIYCYSFDDRNNNPLLLKEQKALQSMMRWIRANDPEQTFIMLQLENEMCVHPELWRPWPPVQLPSTQLSEENTKHLWSSLFHVQACSTRITTVCEMPTRYSIEFALNDTVGRRLWNGVIESRGTHELRIGGDFIDRECKMKVQTYGTVEDIISINNTRIFPIGERCHCHRCNEIYAMWEAKSDQHFQQRVFKNYIKNLASAVAEIDADFPLYLNVLVNDDAKTRLGNPYYDPEDWLNSIPDIDFICPDIYFRSKVAVIDSFMLGRNIIFIPESGQSKESRDRDWVNAFSLIFSVLGVYRGIGIQIYDLQTESFGLLSSEGDWEKNAYLVRNSYCAIRQLPADIFYSKNTLAGFRNVVRKVFHFDGLEIEVRATSSPEYARGIVIKSAESIIICGVGFEAIIREPHLGLENARIERVQWVNNERVILGPPKAGTSEINGNNIRIRMDDDNFLSPQDFEPFNTQYSIMVTLE